MPDEKTTVSPDQIVRQFCLEMAVKSYASTSDPIVGAAKSFYDFVTGKTEKPD